MMRPPCRQCRYFEADKTQEPYGLCHRTAYVDSRCVSPCEKYAPIEADHQPGQEMETKLREVTAEFRRFVEDIESAPLRFISTEDAWRAIHRAEDGL